MNGQKVVVNTSMEEVAVMWDGLTHYFQAGQSRLYPGGVADGIVEQHESLALEEDEEVGNPAPQVPNDEETAATDNPVADLIARAVELGIDPVKYEGNPGLLKAQVMKKEKKLNQA